MAGRRPKRHNATKHGAYAREDFLPGEKPADFERLRSGLAEEWAADGTTEQLLIDQLAVLMWKQQRIDRYDQAVLADKVQAIHAHNVDAITIKETLELAAAFSAASSAEAVEAIMLTLGQDEIDDINQAVPRADVRAEAAAGKVPDPRVAMSAAIATPSQTTIGTGETNSSCSGAIPPTTRPIH